MTVKAVITLILGLVFQLAQVLPAAAVTSACPASSTSCECCDGADSCPCAKDSGSGHKPAPLVPDSGSVLKLPAAKADDTRVCIESHAEKSPTPAIASAPVTVPPGGYAGVRHSVALCSLVI